MIKDPNKRKESWQNWYNNVENKRKHILRVKARNNRIIEENRLWLQQQKEKNPCTDCGKYYPYYVMDYDHLYGKKKTKRRNMYSITALAWSRKKLIEEIEKCELVCANCHRIRTQNRINGNLA